MVSGYDGLLSDAAARAGRYLDALPTRVVAPGSEAVDALEALDGDLPAATTDPAAILELLDRVGSPATVASAGGRYFGFVTGGTHPAALAASLLAGAWDQNTALAVMSPVAARLDAVALRWVGELLGLPPGTGGAFVTGATMANYAGLLAARDEVLARAGWDAGNDGLFGAPPITVVVGAQAHASLHKALAMVGLGRERVVRLPVDSDGAVRAADLPALGAPAIVCLQAGNVSSGACDPFVPLIEWAGEASAWVHVDGAFGLWAGAAPARRHLVAGVEAADSWATDGHKWLNVGYDCGVALVRDPETLARAFRQQAAYLPPGDTRDPLQYGPESSQRARGVEVWALLRTLGRAGVADLVERCCVLARRFASGLIEAGYEVCNDVVLNQVVARFGDDATTRAVITAVQREGTCWFGPTVWRGRAAARISVSSWATTPADIDASVAAVDRVAARLSQA